MKKIISFSLYGNKPNFQVGAVVNVLEAKRLYPDWKCRFYTTDDELVCKQLEYLGAEIVRMDDWPDGNMFWRFLAIDDSDVCISRDTDSVVNEREAAAVNQWLDSDKQWHLMNDHRYHKKHPMMGGMWGFKKGEIIGFDKNTIRKHIQEWIELGNTSEGYGHDQRFLVDVLYPMTHENCIKHGCHGLEFPIHTPCRYGAFVGDYSFHRDGWKGWVLGDQEVHKVWKMFGYK